MFESTKVSEGSPLRGEGEVVLAECVLSEEPDHGAGLHTHDHRSDSRHQAGERIGVGAGGRRAGEGGREDVDDVM
ncbi:MAG: hypothetical protein M5T61_08775 [Acidimicrobiia bacterium]|nr:hypothetical protein [Acidimicrobiia bacterium]